MLNEDDVLHDCTHFVTFHRGRKEKKERRRLSSPDQQMKKEKKAMCILTDLSHRSFLILAFSREKGGEKRKECCSVVME